jgi:hypothetical protein
MCQGAVERLCAAPHSCDVRKVARLLAQALNALVFPFPATLNAGFLIRLDEVAVTITLLPIFPTKPRRMACSHSEQPCQPAKGV